MAIVPNILKMTKENKKRTKKSFLDISLSILGILKRNFTFLIIFLRNQPLVVGPSRQQQIVCVECLLPVDGKITCPDCQLPMCQKCVSKINESLWHRTLECPFLQKQGFKVCELSNLCHKNLTFRNLGWSARVMYLSLVR